jgi:hypothetical protein
VNGRSDDAPGATFGTAVDVAFAPAVVTANIASSLFQFGVGAAARSTEAGAWLLEGIVPGARPARLLSRDVSRRGAAAGREAFGLAFNGVKAALGRLRDQDFDKRPPGFNQLAGNTLAGPASDVLLWPATLLLDFVGGARELAPVRDNLSRAWRVFNSAMDIFSISGTATRVNTFQLRDHFLSMTVGPGGAVVRDLIGFPEGALRASVGNTQRLAAALSAGLESMRYFAGYGEAGLLYPEVPITRSLYLTARKIADNEPVRLIKALKASDPGAIASALIAERTQILTFLSYYPQALLGVMGAVVGFLAIGLRDVNDVERYVLDEEDLLAKLRSSSSFAGLDDRDQQKLLYRVHPGERPFTITQFEFYAGNAKSSNHPEDVAHMHPELPASGFSQATVNFAQESAFSYSCLLVGRAKAAERMQRLFGQEVRERIERDPSLTAIQFSVGFDSEHHAVSADIDEFIAREKPDGDWEEYYVTRIEFLRSYRDNPNTFMLQTMRDRIDGRLAILEEALRRLRMRAASSARVTGGS